MRWIKGFFSAPEVPRYASPKVIPPNPNPRTLAEALEERRSGRTTKRMREVRAEIMKIGPCGFDTIMTPPERPSPAPTIEQLMERQKTQQLGRGKAMEAEIEKATLVNKDGSIYPYKGSLGRGTVFKATPISHEGTEGYLIEVEDANGGDSVVVPTRVMDDQEALDRVVADMVRKRNELEEKRRGAQEKVVSSAKYNYGLLNGQPPRHYS